MEGGTQKDCTKTPCLTLVLGKRNLAKCPKIVFHKNAITGFDIETLKTIPKMQLKYIFACRCPCWQTCLNTKWGHHWTRMRTAIVSVVDTPAFEWFVLVLIFASSITLCFEDIHLDSNKTLKRILYWTNFVFSLIFVIEMVLKWMALGFTKYFTSFWTILDFIIVFVSLPLNIFRTKRMPGQSVDFILYFFRYPYFHY